MRSYLPTALVFPGRAGRCRPLTGFGCVADGRTPPLSLRSGSTYALAPPFLRAQVLPKLKRFTRVLKAVFKPPSITVWFTPSNYDVSHSMISLKTTVSFICSLPLPRQVRRLCLSVLVHSVDAYFSATLFLHEMGGPEPAWFRRAIQRQNPQALRIASRIRR
jgi:hypothetical protein